LFFALWPAHALQVSLAETTQNVVLAAGGRPVPPENFHVTLAFLGLVPEVRISQVRAIAQEVANEVAHPPVQVNFDAIEYWKKPGLVCATARPATAGNASAAALAGALKSHLTGAGFTPDLKPFRAHITLARKAVHPIPTMDLDPVAWSFGEFVLVESRTELQGAVYRVLESCPLSRR
jgi:2'-5' RNA ligase